MSSEFENGTADVKSGTNPIRLNGLWGDDICERKEEMAKLENVRKPHSHDSFQVKLGSISIDQ